MGCGSSKDATADLAGNFFGEDPSLKRGSSDPKNGTTTSAQTVPMKPALAKKNAPVVDASAKHPQTSSTTPVSRSSESSGGKKKIGTPKASNGGDRNMTSLQGSKPDVRISHSSTSSSDRNNGNVRSSSSNNNNSSSMKTGGSKKQKRKNDYVAPPSSESFVTGSQKVSTAKNSEFSVPPPPPKYSTSNPTTSRDSQGHNQEVYGIDDDDDFTVAPSLATTYRSVVKTSFDQIYERGRKVRTYKSGTWKPILLLLSSCFLVAAWVRCFCSSLHWCSSPNETGVRHQASGSFQNVLGRS